MPSTTTEATREELLAEYVVREALHDFENRVAGILWQWDRDLVDQMSHVAGISDGLRADSRYNDLFESLWPASDEDIDQNADYRRAAAESSRLAARIMRAVVYEADWLREEADRLLEISRKFESPVEEATVDA